MNFKKLTRLAKSKLETIYNLKIKLFSFNNGEVPIVIQGIQRSGTNYLNEILKNNNYRVLNYYDPQRNNPKHKHFRWQSDKNSISMDSRYMNNIVVDSISQVNLISGYDEPTKHVVIYRPPEKWLSSIYRWGKSNNWFVNKEEFINSKISLYLNEWDSYYSFWRDMHKKSPSLVSIINYDDLKHDPVKCIKDINKQLNIDIEPLGNNNIKKVRHSKNIDVTRENIDFSRVKEFVDFDFKFKY